MADFCAARRGIIPPLTWPSSHRRSQTSRGGERDGARLRGWRRTVFGDEALRLGEGPLALGASGSRVRLVEV